MRHCFHPLCPYFAMFPEQFAEKWIERWVLQEYTVSYLVRRQTGAFRPGSVGCRFEIDFCFDLYQ